MGPILVRVPLAVGAAAIASSYHVGQINRSVALAPSLRSQSPHPIALRCCYVNAHFLSVEFSNESDDVVAEQGLKRGHGETGTTRRDESACKEGRVCLKQLDRCPSAHRVCRKVDLRAEVDLVSASSISVITVVNQRQTLVESTSKACTTWARMLGGEKSQRVRCIRIIRSRLTETLTFRVRRGPMYRQTWERLV